MRPHCLGYIGFISYGLVIGLTRLTTTQLFWTKCKDDAFSEVIDIK